jgi:hypothetical protein
MPLCQINIISILEFREPRVSPELTFRNKKLRSHYINRKRYSGTKNGSQGREYEPVRMAGFAALLGLRQASLTE